MKLRVAPGPHGIVATWLVCRRTIITRLDGWPWFILHAAAYALATSPGVVGVLESFSVPIILSASIVAHVLCMLGQFWSVRWYYAMRFKAATDSEDADSVFIEPVPHAGSVEIVPLVRKVATKLDLNVMADASPDDLSPQWLGSASLGFSYQSCQYDLVPSRCGEENSKSTEFTVSRLVLPDVCTLHSYQSWLGWCSSDAATALTKWGPNSIIMPSPTFMELMAEAVLAPFFVFQISCVLLWALDDFWYYSLFTLFTLFSLEGMMVGARMKQRAGLRAVSLSVD